MSKLPEAVSKGWNDHKGPVILATMNADGTPNIIYATCVGKYDEETLIVADNYFSKTRENLQAGCKGSILFMTNDDKAFQVKGSLEYHKEGPYFDNMKSWNPEKHPGNAAAVLKVEEVYAGSEKLA